VINLTPILPRSPRAGRLSVRHVVSKSFGLGSSRKEVFAPGMSKDEGAMVSVAFPGGIGFCATADLSRAGLARAAQQAEAIARLSLRCGVYQGIDLDTLMPIPRKRLEWRSPIASVEHDRRPWIDLVRESASNFGDDERLVYWAASIQQESVEQNLYVDGQWVSDQKFLFISPSVHATVEVNGIRQSRHLGGRATTECQQGGDEQIARSGFVGLGQRATQEAIELASAPPCPKGVMDLLLMPDQMVLQIHESIGHPLELDRILGDERNYAGASFVTPDMFGTYQYGSELLNIRFDPGESQATRPELASFANDDMANVASSKRLIERGILIRPLGSPLSCARAAKGGVALDPVANARASSWRRPPIDRMANVNLEPGESSLDEMIGAVEDGVLMSTNVSWSIDDSRNKFQFGCEWGRRIRNGKLAEVVRGSGYRGVSSYFWRSLAMVGNESTYAVMGTPNCGKGEPNQGVRVGHASPACLFKQVEVFGPAA